MICLIIPRHCGEIPGVVEMNLTQVSQSSSKPPRSSNQLKSLGCQIPCFHVFIWKKAGAHPIGSLWIPLKCLIWALWGKNVRRNCWNMCWARLSWVCVIIRISRSDHYLWLPAPRRTKLLSLPRYLRALESEIYQKCSWKRQVEKRYKRRQNPYIVPCMEDCRSGKIFSTG